MCCPNLGVSLRYDADVIESLDFSGLSKSQVNSLRSIGRVVLDFLGAQKISDDAGFSILWREESRKSPL